MRGVWERKYKLDIEFHVHSHFSDLTQEAMIWIEIFLITLNQTQNVLNQKRMRWKTGSQKFNFCLVARFMVVHWYVQKVI